METPRKFSRALIEGALKAFGEGEDYGMILRSKGMVPQKDGSWIYFDFVDGEYEIREGTPYYTGKICVIGTDLQEEKLAKLFESED
jgi:hypothetical protein